MAGVMEWPFKLLHQQRHRRLVENLQEISSVSGIPIDYLDHSMAELGCSENEVEWVKTVYPSRHLYDKKGGLILVGREFDPPPENRLMAMGAAFLRNYIDARYVPLDELLIRLTTDDDSGFNPTVLIIPDFHRVSSAGKTLPEWQIRKVYSYLVERFSSRRATVMHVDDEKKLVNDYGKSFHTFLWSNWSRIEPDTP